MSTETIVLGLREDEKVPKVIGKGVLFSNINCFHCTIGAEYSVRLRDISLTPLSAEFL